MSKIGDFNIAMTEKVNELGYETVEEAIANGWDSNEFYMSYMEEAKDEQEKAHEAWLKEKDSVLNKLTAIEQYFITEEKASSTLGAYEEAFIESQLRDYAKDTIEFIKKGEQ